jgi:hypothetical protein
VCLAGQELLNSSHHYLHLRARIDERGDALERWWATVLLGHIHLYSPAPVGYVTQSSHLFPREHEPGLLAVCCFPMLIVFTFHPHWLLCSALYYL